MGFQKFSASLIDFVPNVAKFLDNCAFYQTIFCLFISGVLLGIKIVWKKFETATRCLAFDYGLDNIHLSSTEQLQGFFTSIPCSYTSLPLDGVARNYYYYHFSTWIRLIIHFFMSGSIFSYLLCQRRKTIWSLARIDPRPSCFTSDRSNH